MKIGIIGVGYVGLTTAICLASMKHEISIFDINEEKIVEAEIIDRVEEFYSDGKETFAISTGDYGINLTIFHIIPYYRDGELIIDNCGTVDVGDEFRIYSDTNH